VIVHEITPSTEHIGAIPIGRPIANTRVCILNECLEPVPHGAVGEICIGGVGLARGYWKQPGLTAERFIADPFVPGQRLYRTGDLGRHLESGEIEFLGRNDSQVKIRGYRVELNEIEAALLRHPKIMQAAVILDHQLDPEGRLLAYVSRTTAALEYANNGPAEQSKTSKSLVDAWRQVYEEIHLSAAGAATADFTGWMSSFTDEQIAVAEMQEWLDHTINWIRRFNPQRILEIGCGTGLLLERLAPHCQSYVATDFSQHAIESLRRRLHGASYASRVRLSCSEALDFESLGDEQYDTVILNSVLQYFPNGDYLISTLDNAIKRITKGGRLLLGDVRRLDLLPVFHGSVQLSRSDTQTTAGEFRRRLSRALSHEKELVVHPGFFAALGAQHAEIGAVEISMTSAKSPNQRVRYCCDIALHISDKRPSMEESIPWSPNASEDVSSLLAACHPPVLRIKAIPEIDLRREIALWRELTSCGAELGVRSMQETADQSTGVAPDVDAIFAIAAKHGYFCRKCWSGDVLPDEYELVLSDPHQAPLVQTSARMSGYGASFNIPARPLVDGDEPLLDAGVRAHLERFLPRYMIPSAIIVLDALPLTANGKLDRKALPPPEAPRRLLDSAWPRTLTEQIVADIWSDVLEVAQVGVHDDFFELGGHSLSAIRAIVAIREALGREVPLGLFLEHPKLGDMCQCLDRMRYDISWPQLTAKARPTLIRLSFAQERLWFQDRLGLLGAAYNEPVALRFRGALDIEALRLSLTDLVRRHERLRTGIMVRSGVPYQVITAACEVALETRDIQTQGNADAIALRMVQEIVERRFDLERDPLLRAALLRFSSTEHLLVLVIHHIVCDGWSLSLLQDELVTSYQAFFAGGASPLPAPPVQYADYALWQRDVLDAGRFADQLSYWRKQLAGASAALELPSDRPRGATATSAGARVPFKISRDVAEALVRLGRNSGATLYMVLLAALNIVLTRWSGQPDIVIGSPIAGRSHGELDRVIGFFINSVALRTNLLLADTFEDLLRNIKETAIHAYANQDLPFDQLVAELRESRDLSRQPIFQVMFALQNFPRHPLEPAGITVTREIVKPDASKFDLYIAVTPTENGLMGLAEYATALFDEYTIERLVRHFCRVLAQVVAEPQTKLRQLDVLDPSERRQVLVEWNQWRQPYDIETQLQTPFERHAQLFPGDLAVVTDGDRLSYAELHLRCNQLASVLDRGRPSTTLRPIGLLMNRHVDLITGMIAILKAGAFYVPLDPSWPARRIAAILDELRVETLLVDSSLASIVAEICVDEAREVHVVCIDERNRGGDIETFRASELRNGSHPTRRRIAWASLPGEALHCPTPSAAPAYAIFTSGSTGVPKGILVSHRSVINTIEWVNRTFCVGRQDQVLFVTSPCFDLSVYDVFGTLAAGASIRLVGDTALREPAALAELLVREPITIWDSAPAALQQLMPFLRPLKAREACRLRLVLNSGDWIPLSLPPEIGKLFPAAQFIALGGATEASIWSNWHEVTQVQPHWQSVPYGKPIQNAQYYVLDERLEPAPLGVPGDLYIAGECLAISYIKGGMTAERFIANPHGPPGSRMYATGDRARWRVNGELEFLGRLDGQVKIRGYRVEVAEIEAALAACPNVERAIVMAHGSAVDGKRLIAYVVCPSADRPAIHELRKQLQQVLP
jgi:pristinamycin I synthase-3/4